MNNDPGTTFLLMLGYFLRGEDFLRFFRHLCAAEQRLKKGKSRTNGKQTATISWSSENS